MNLSKYILRVTVALALPLAFPMTGLAAETGFPSGQFQSSGKKVGKKPVKTDAGIAGKDKAVGKSEKGKKSQQRKGKTAGKKNEKASALPSSETVKSRYWALKVNVPYAAAVVQNLEFEAQVARKWTVALPVMWSISDLANDHGLRTIALQPEARWWEGKRTGDGHFVGFHANLAWFNLKWNDTRYQARHTPLMGAGISYGYKLPLSAHWGAEFSLGVGYAYMKYDMYYNIDNGAKRGTGSHHYFGPDRVAVSLVYRF